MQLVKHLGAFTKESRDIINSNFEALTVGGTTGKVYYVDPANGGDSIDENRGQDIDTAYATIYRGYAQLRTGRNDAVLLVPNGASTGAARLSVANAVASDVTATTGTLTWSKSAAHLIGLGPSGMNGGRCRLAPPSGTYTFATFGSGNFVVVSGSGNYFKNINIYQAFSTGDTDEIACTVSGSYNVFENCHFAGSNDAAAAADAGSRSLKVTGQYNIFRNCTIGYTDATARRSAANASLEFASAAANNYFIDCYFPFKTATSTVLGIITSAAGAMGQLNHFERCNFVNSGALAGGASMAAVATLAASSGGGLFMKDCARMLITDWGTDATSLAQIYGNSAANAAASWTGYGDDVGRAVVAVAS
jgi:hypothetical protein